jgi:hypothetical protein
MRSLRGTVKWGERNEPEMFGPLCKIPRKSGAFGCGYLSKFNYTGIDFSSSTTGATRQRGRGGDPYVQYGTYTACTGPCTVSCAGP